MATHQHTTLLVGREFLQSADPNGWFLRRRSQCRVASTVGEVCELTRSHRFDLILSDYHLPDGTGFELLDRFPVPPASYFLSHRVENGCIWLPAILRGVRCWGSAVLRPAAFIRLLGDLISGDGQG
jgi:hypothetical protein